MMKKLAYTLIALAAVCLLASLSCWFLAIWSKTLGWPMTATEALANSGFMGILTTGVIGFAGFVLRDEAERAERASR